MPDHTRPRHRPRGREFLKMTVRQQRYLLTVLWRHAMRAARGDRQRAAAFLPRIMAAAGVRCVVIS
jgi:hypothetical protein